MTRIEVVCGFLESGKTTLIQRILEQEYTAAYRRILILQCEEGTAELDARTVRNKNVLLDRIESPDKLRSELFRKIAEELDPDLILVEYNGTWPLEALLRLKLPRGLRIDRVLFCAEAETFPLYLGNTGTLMQDQLSNADAVLFRGPAEPAPLRALVKSAGGPPDLFFTGEEAGDFLAGVFDPVRAKAESRRLLRGRAAIFAAFALLFFILVRDFSLPGVMPAVSSVNMVFLGILMQALPFLLIGAFVSALLQTFVPDETLVRLFTRRRWLGFPLAAVLGVFFPICDCGIVPIASRLAQKGVPLPQAMVFLLAAPAVNPVTIVSTLYAFPGQPQYALARAGLGALTALIAGAALSLSRVRTEDVLTAAAASCSCAAGYSPRHAGAAGRAEAVFLTAGREFLNMGRYIIVGALACAVLQQTVPVSLFRGAGKSAVLPVLLMLLAAFFLSVCSTSNAFIGRSFLNVFPAAAVMGFLVMGPMLDLSNLFLLSGSFRRRFVVRLAATLLAVAVPLFLLLSAVLKGGSL